MDDIGGYDEASIRYLGRKIPSKSFQLLQSMTGGPSPDGKYHIKFCSCSLIFCNRANQEVKVAKGTFHCRPKVCIFSPSFASDATPRRGGPRRTPQRSTPQRSTPQREPKHIPDDGVDISYVGSNIPSKSFQYIQQSVSQPGQNSAGGESLFTILFRMSAWESFFAKENMPP